MTQGILTNPSFTVMLNYVHLATSPNQSWGAFPTDCSRERNTLIFEECGPVDFFCPFVVIASSLSLRGLRFSNSFCYRLNWCGDLERCLIPQKFNYPICLDQSCLPHSQNVSESSQVCWTVAMAFYHKMPFQGLSVKWFFGSWASQWETENPVAESDHPGSRSDFA